MAPLAAVCGVLIVLYGLMVMRPAATDAQLALEIICFVGGLILCFLAVVLARLARLLRKLETSGAVPADTLARRPEGPANEAVRSERQVFGGKAKR